MIKEKLTAILFIVLASVAQVLHADAPLKQGVPGQQQLSLTCQVSNSSIPPLTDFPIWIDVYVTNRGSAPFNGFYSRARDYGMSATTPSTENSFRAVARDGIMEGLANNFTLKAGGTVHLRVLLNDLLPVIQPDVLSCRISLPLGEITDHGHLSLTLAASLTVNVGPALTPEQMQAACGAFVTSLESEDRDTRDDAEREVRVLPDTYAIPILTRVTQDIPFAPWVIDDIGTRPRTPETTRALMDLAHSPNADTRSVAKIYLSHANLPQ